VNLCLVDETLGSLAAGTAWGAHPANESSLALPSPSLLPTRPAAPSRCGRKRRLSKWSLAFCLHL